MHARTAYSNCILEPYEYSTHCTIWSRQLFTGRRPDKSGPEVNKGHTDRPHQGVVKNFTEIKTTNPNNLRLRRKHGGGNSNESGAFRKG